MNFCTEIQRDRGGIEKMKSRNLKAMLFGAAFAASLTFVGAQPQMPLFSALEVHAASYQDVELDSKYDFEKAFQKALDVARDSEDKNTIYRIKIPAGTYKAGSCFNVYSNTYIDMEGVTLIRTSGSSMFRFGRSEDVKKISGYTGFKNITFHGGTIDGQGAQHGYKSTLLRFAHASDVTIENMTLTNTYSSHSIEFAAAQNVTINNCVFSDYHGKADSNNEAIQIETLQKDHFASYGKYDETPNRNITITNCTFKNVQRGVGTHAAIVGCYHSNIRIENNKFINIPGYTIIATNYINSSIKNNEITDCASGIIFRDMAITLYPSEKGNKSKTPKISSKSVIANNKIEITDKKYKNVNYGIQLLGEYRSKKKGNIPKGDYRVYGVQVYGNEITLKNASYGIWLNGTGKIRVNNNVINMQVPKKASGKSGGTVVRVISSKGSRINGNTIINTSKNKNKKLYRGIELIGKKAGSASGNKFKGFAKKQQTIKRKS